MAITGNSYASKLSGLYLDRWNLDWKWPQWKSGHQRFLLRFFLFSWASCQSVGRWSSQTRLQILSSVPLRLESVFSLCSFIIQIARKLFESIPIQRFKNGDKYYSKENKANKNIKFKNFSNNKEVCTFELALNRRVRGFQVNKQKLVRIFLFSHNYLMSPILSSPYRELNSPQKELMSVFDWKLAWTQG